MNNEKRNYLFVLFSTLARGMIEIFIPIYLYKAGFSLEAVFSYFLLMLLFSMIICYPLVKIGTRIKYKNLIFLSTFFLILTYYTLINIVHNPYYLVFLALIYSLYRRAYWIGRRYYSLTIIPTKNMGSKIGILVILGQIATMSSAYLGALILNNTNNITLFSISIFIFILGISFFIKIPESNNNNLTIPKNIIKKIPFKNFIFMFLNEAIYIATFAFPIYLYIFIKDNFEYIGIFNIFVGISSIIFIYFFSKKIDRDKKDYKYIAYIGLGVCYLLKLKILSMYAILLVGLLEGTLSKMQDVVFTRNIYYLGSHFNKATYNLVCELVQNGARLIIFLLIFLFTRDLKTILYICSFIIIINAFIKFDDGKDNFSNF